MPTCPKCGSELELFRGKKFVCSNEHCDFIVIEQATIPWFRRLCQDDSLWYRDAFETYPSIVAHEYWRVYDLLKNGQAYGAFMQLKDVFEVLLKFPTLICASLMYAKPERSDEENKILITLLGRFLALGNWEIIARTMSKEIPLNATISIIHRDVIAMFQKNQIREWRNEEIGHGALRFDVNEEFQRDIGKKLCLIKEHFQRCAGTYAKLTFFLRVHGQRILLHGKDNARNLHFCP